MSPVESFDEIVKYLDEKKDTEEVKNFVNGLKPKDEELNLDKFLEKAQSNESIEKYLQSQRDKAVMKGLETYKGKYKDREGNVEAIVQAELDALRNKLQPEETETQKELRMVKEELAKDKSERQKERMQNYFYKKFNEAKLPASLIEQIRLAEDEETANAMVETLSTIWKSELEREVEARLAGNIRDPQKSTNPVVNDDTKLSDHDYFMKKGITGR